MHEDYVAIDEEQKTGMSTATKVGIGCLSAAILVVLLSCVGIIALAFWGVGKLDEFAEPYVEQGYERVFAHMIDVRENIDVDTVYTGQIVNIYGDVHANIAIFAQAATIHGRVEGDIDVFCQTFTIERDAVVTGNINSKGVQVLTIHGTVEGRITGTYQVIGGRNVPEGLESP